MSTNGTPWNDTLMNDWMATQQKYWETWRDFAQRVGGLDGGSGSAAANPFAAFNPFAAGASAPNPFAQMFGQNPFARMAGQNPFTQAFSGQNAFAQNPFAQAGSGQNPFAGMLDQWWSSISPQFDGDIGSVAQRFYDMGKSFMSMSEGLFGTAGQEQPQAAMEMWMSSMHTALQQWITQIQNNMDVITPDLPGISGTTLSTWAQLADSIAPWLTMSQDYLKDLAAGHFPGGIEMPGVGAAQEQFLRALSVPGLGYTREQQERIQLLAHHLLNYHDALRAYKLAFAKTAMASLEAVQMRLREMHEEGETIESLRALYDMWVAASEKAYAEFALSDEYQVVYGDLVNTLMQVRADMNELAEQQYRQLHIPTRSEIDTMQHRQQENRRESRQLRKEIAALRAQIEALTGDTTAPAKHASGSTDSSARQSARAKPAGRSRKKSDLTEIKGVGPKMAEKLYNQGINSFEQLAEMNEHFAEKLDDMLEAQGRILRDDWIGQAKKLID